MLIKQNLYRWNNTTMTDAITRYWKCSICRMHRCRHTTTQHTLLVFLCCCAAFCCFFLFFSVFFFLIMFVDYYVLLHLVAVVFFLKPHTLSHAHTHKHTQIYVHNSAASMVVQKIKLNVFPWIVRLQFSRIKHCTLWIFHQRVNNELLFNIFIWFLAFLHW